MKLNAGAIIVISLVVLVVVLVGGPLMLGNLLRSNGDMSTQAPGEFTFGKSKRNSTSNFRATPAQVTANNTAVKFITQDKNEEAIDVLEPLLKDSPDYDRARENLAIAYNNLALKQVRNPRVALDSVWRSWCLAPEVGTTRQNLDALLKRLKINGNSFDERVEMADSQNALGCLYGAYSEYSAALALREDAVIRAKLDGVIARAKEAGSDDVNGAFFVQMAVKNLAGGKDSVTGKGKSSGSVISARDVDYGDYMAELQKSIKRSWHPPRSAQSKRLKVSFEVERDGLIRKGKVIESSGDAAADKAGLDALEELGKAAPLPEGAPESVAIEFTFDYNVWKQSQKVQ